MSESVEAVIAREVTRLAARLAPLLGAGKPTGEGRLEKALSLEFFRERLLGLNRGLTQREADVCARALIGLTAEGTALDLRISKASVCTYRKRAYARLGISSQFELFRMLI